MNMSDSVARVTPNMSSATRSKKLTVERICGKLGPMAPDQEGRWHCDVYCYVTGEKRESSTFGDYSRWLGEFKTINLTTGEVLVSATAILPAIASDLIEAAYRGGNNIGGEASNVMLAFRIGSIYGMNKAGYVYTLRDIVAPSTKSPLDRLYDEVNLPLIGGSVKTAAVEDQRATAAVEDQRATETVERQTVHPAEAATGGRSARK
jgi:hypothetical protein